jgi:hypothetical protein
MTVTVTNSSAGSNPDYQVKTTLDGSDLVQHVKVDSSALPSGASTNTKLDEVITAIGTISVSIASVDVTSSVLPTGASTSAKQDAQTALLTTIDADTATLAAAVVGGKVQIEGDISVDTTGLATEAKQDDIISALASVPVTGTFWQATQPVSGTVTANLGTLNGAATEAKQNDIITALGSIAIDTTGLALETKQDIGNTSVASIDTKTPALGQALAAASVPVVLTAAQISTLTPPAAITGFATEATLSTLNGKVTACNTGAVTISAALPAGNNNIGDVDVATLPAITGTVTANLGTLNGAATAANQTTIIGHIDGVETLIGTTNTTLTTIDGRVDGIEGLIGTTNTNTAATTTALQIMDDWDESDRAKVNIIVGTAGVTGNTGTVDAGTQRVTLATNVALPAGTNNIGDVDILSMPTSGTATLANVAGSASSVTLIASNASRKGGTIWNDSTAILYVKFGTTASTTSATVKMVADSYYEIPYGYTGIVTGIWASATGSARVTELT